MAENLQKECLCHLVVDGLSWLTDCCKIKGVGMVRAIFGPVQDSAVFVIFCLNMLCLSKILCFKSICLVFYILGLKVQKTTKNRRFLEKFNIFLKL